MKAKKYSFQIPMNWKIATVTSPGFAKGSSTRQNADASEQPSTTAASYNDRGSDLKNPARIKIAKGSPFAV
jgi:hypothetical protein